MPREPARCDDCDEPPPTRSGPALLAVSRRRTVGAQVMRAMNCVELPAFVRSYPILSQGILCSAAPARVRGRRMAVDQGQIREFHSNVAVVRRPEIRAAKASPGGAF